MVGVCSMCGDVGFPDKLFHCSKCRNRFQHFYCSNYYSEYAEPIEICDWCQCEERNPSSSSSRNNKHANEARKIKQQRSDHKPTGKTPSPRPSARSCPIKVILSADYCEGRLRSFGRSITAAKQFCRSILDGSMYASVLQFVLLLCYSWLIIIESFMQLFIQLFQQVVSESLY
ncbi:uncharacterized protein LOC121794790 [Salvia splendens]|uniref:uncharacterized protein LOC121794790 n=1 Tax=Salvia splendens TaxID=180675 RepID=UPI001C278A1D|nr:uncharacterized protein LOC121794790 [Salvia splendens]